MQPPLIRGVLFDCDGVLVNSEPYIIEAELNLLKKFGVEMDEAEYHKTIKGKKLDDKRTAFLKLLPPEAMDSEFNEQLQEIHDEEHDNITPEHIMPGVIEILEFLTANNIPFAVCSNSRGFNLIGKMENTGLDKYFGDHNTFSYEDAMGKSKPHPALYLLGAKKIGVDPTQCVVIDDSKTGVLAGFNAGALTIGFGDEALYDHGADIVSEDMYHVLDDIVPYLDLNPRGPEFSLEI